MSAVNSVPGNETLQATSKEEDDTEPRSLDLKCNNLDGNARCVNSAEIGQSQLEDSEGDVVLTSRDVLYSAACKEMSNYAKCFVNGYVPIIKLILNKLKALPQKSVALKNKMLELQSVLVQIESIDLNADFVYEDDLYAIVREIGKVEDDFVAMVLHAKVQYKTNACLLQQISAEVGFEAKEERLTEARHLLVKNFADALDNFSATISDAERKTEWELVEFYERFRAASEFEQQFNYFDQFWPMFW